MLPLLGLLFGLDPKKQFPNLASTKQAKLGILLASILVHIVTPTWRRFLKESCVRNCTIKTFPHIVHGVFFPIPQISMVFPNQSLYLHHYHTIQFIIHFKFQNATTRMIRPGWDSPVIRRAIDLGMNKPQLKTAIIKRIKVRGSCLSNYPFLNIEQTTFRPKR